ncbi:hypothetical protein Hanom_Chr05g00398841 [Helianthus anomalus]
MKKLIFLVYNLIWMIKCKLQVLSFMFTSNCRHCPFGEKFTGGVLNLPKSCTFCPLGQTWLEMSVNSFHVQCT